MPDFTARIAVGASSVPWIDPTAPATPLPGTLPTRLNANPSYLHRYDKVIPPASVEIRATVGGVEAPLDAALGGRLFLASWAQWSGPWPPAIVQPLGQSSVAQVALTAEHLGYFQLLLWRDGGGAVALPFNVEA